MRFLANVEISYNFVWDDRHAWNPWSFGDYYTLRGNLDRYKVKKQDGRPITLNGTEAWLTQNQVDELGLLAESAGKMTLLWSDTPGSPTESYSVIFSQDLPFNLSRIAPNAPFFSGTIFLLEKN